MQQVVGTRENAAGRGEGGGVGVGGRQSFNWQTSWAGQGLFEGQRVRTSVCRGAADQWAATWGWCRRRSELRRRSMTLLAGTITFSRGRNGGSFNGRAGLVAAPGTGMG